MLGLMLDKIGMRCYILTIGFFTLSLSQFIFIRLETCNENEKCYEGIFPMALVGMSNTIIQLTLYSSVNFIIPEKHYGSGYGLMQAIDNIGSAIGYLLVGYMLDENSLKADMAEQT